MASGESKLPGPAHSVLRTVARPSCHPLRRPPDPCSPRSTLPHTQETRKCGAFSHTQLFGLAASPCLCPGTPAHPTLAKEPERPSSDPAPALPTTHCTRKKGPVAEDIELQQLFFPFCGSAPSAHHGRGAIDPSRSRSQGPWATAVPRRVEGWGGGAQWEALTALWLNRSKIKGRS